MGLLSQKNDFNLNGLSINYLYGIQQQIRGPIKMQQKLRTQQYI
jgi:hypothetical protein